MGEKISMGDENLKKKYSKKADSKVIFIIPFYVSFVKKNSLLVVSGVNI